MLIDFFIFSFDWKTLNINAKSNPSNEVEVEFVIFDIENQVPNKHFCLSQPGFVGIILQHVSSLFVALNRCT